jgi:hypothetical protein
MLTITLADMLDQVRFHADVPAFTTTTAITTSDATKQLNVAVRELFRLFIDAGGDKVYRKKWPFVTKVDQYAYKLPADLYEITDVEIILSNSFTDRIQLKPFTPAERPLLLSASPGWNGEPFKYCRYGKDQMGSGDTGVIEFLPKPTSYVQIEVFYIFCPTTLVNPGDTLDGFAGFEDYAIQLAASRLARWGEDYEKADRLAAEAERVKLEVMQGMHKLDALNPPMTNRTRDQWAPRYLRRWAR